MVRAKPSSPTRIAGVLKHEVISLAPLLFSGPCTWYVFKGPPPFCLFLFFHHLLTLPISPLLHDHLSLGLNDNTTPFFACFHLLYCLHSPSAWNPYDKISLLPPSLGIKPMIVGLQESQGPHQLSKEWSMQSAQILSVRLRAPGEF